MSPSLTAGAKLPESELTIPISLLPSPWKLKLIPSSSAAHVINSLMECCFPVAMMKSSGSSCCNINHCMRTNSRASPQSLFEFIFPI